MVPQNAAGPVGSEPMLLYLVKQVELAGLTRTEISGLRRSLHTCHANLALERTAGSRG